MIIASCSAAPKLASSVGISVGGIPGNYLDLKRTVYRYNLYYEYILSNLTNALTLYSEGKFTELESQFPSSQLKIVALQNLNFDLIYANRIDTLTDVSGTAYDYDKTLDDAMFINYKEMTGKVLTGFGHSLETQNLLATSQERAYELQTILDTPSMLESYIQQKRNITHFAFDAVVPLQLSIQLKPWFRDYLREYGPPYDGVFDAHRMARVVQNLINTGEITAEEFIEASV
jgi:hypothetical protein